MMDDDRVQVVQILQIIIYFRVLFINHGIIRVWNLNLNHFAILLFIFSFCLSFTSCKPALASNSCDTTSQKYLILQFLLSAINPNMTLCGAPRPTTQTIITKPSDETGATSVPVSSGVTVSAPSLGFTLKNGGLDSVTLKLTKEPNAAVTLPLGVSPSSQATVAPSSLSFTSANWNIPQTVTVTGLDDVNYGVSANFILTFGPSVSSDTSFNGLSGSSTAITNRDYRKLIFVSNLTQGNLGGISGADSLCNSDSNKPVNTGSYKALIVHPGVRVASVTANTGDGQIDWVLLPNQLYTRSTGLPIMTTNAASIYLFGPNLANSVYTAGDAIWTGFSAANDWTADGGCTGWTVTGGNGPYSVGNSVTFQSLLFGGSIVCTNNGRLYCVQQ